MIAALLKGAIKSYMYSTRAESDTYITKLHTPSRSSPLAHHVEKYYQKYALIQANASDLP